MLIKREQKSLTFMVIPHNSNSVFNVQISYKIVYLLVLAAVTVGTVVLNLSWNYNRLKATPVQLENAQSERAQVEAHLEGEVVTLHQNTEELAEQLQVVEKEAAVLGEIIGVDKEEISEAIRSRERRLSRGGALPSRAMTPELYALRRSVDAIKIETRIQLQTIQSLTDIARAKQAKLAATPSIWPADGYISSDYGSRRHPISGRREFHAAIDIVGAYGDPIRATADGAVVRSTYQSGYGNVIVVDHGNQYKTLYAHNSRNLVQQGRTVKKGEVIALMGATGVTTGTHVHYEVWVNGETANPNDYVDIRLAEIEL